MQKYLLIAISLLISFCHNAEGQNYKYKYLLDKNLYPADQTNAIYIGKGFQEGNQIKVDFFDKTNGKILITAHFKDSTLGEFEGFYQSFHRNSKPKQAGNYANGKQDGIWNAWDSSGLKTIEILFQTGGTVSKTEYYYEDSKLISKSTKDQNGDEIAYTMFDKKGNEIKDDKIFTKVDVQPVFNNGNASFQNYILQFVDKNVPYSRGAPSGRYLATINFVVEKDGKITEVQHESVSGYGIEAEAVRVIKLSPSWTPALKDGRPVRYRMKEFVPFVVNR